MTTTKPVQSRTETTVSTSTTNKRAENAFAALGNSASARAAGLIEPTSGLGDPFAEIFARIATSETVSPSEPPPAPQESLATETEDRDDSNEDDVEASDDTAPAAAVTTTNHLAEETSETESAEKAVATSNEEDESSERPDDVAWAQKTDSSDEGEAIGTEQATDEVEPLVDPNAEKDLEESSTEGVLSEEVAVSVNSDPKRRSSEQTSDASAEATTLKTDQVDASEETTGKDHGTSETNESSLSDEQSNDRASHDSRRTERRRYSREDGGNTQGTATASAGASSAEGGIEIDSSLTASGADSEVSETQLNQLAEQAAAKTSTPAATVAPVTAMTAAATNAAKPAAGGTNAISSSNSAASSTSGNNDPTNPINNASPSAEKAESKAKAGLQASGVDQTSAVARAKLVQRVSRGFQTLGPNGGHIRMRLSPVELGSVQLEVHIQENNLRGRMVTESEAASQLLREHLPQLRSQLESQGMRLESIEITTDPNGASEFDQTQNALGDRDHSDRDARSDQERYRNRGNTSGTRPIDAKPAAQPSQQQPLRPG
ncbi:flagellar hook-length control protein FliK [Rhodopirellula europaea]|uniref:Flagellar hook-length control protein FliK n=1 Tax=Rhodopirellula europaea 6C TaxID=1263867 RepID=M2A409_9BACT|nr:flagellar hook-length control protein FliK [Rhodopirellula europaea]EMB14131.1 flagellar hook-length control protein FliK [Rhodopirellula europaea 6C]